MAHATSYATSVELQAFVGASVALPADSDRLLKRATDLVRAQSRGRGDTAYDAVIAGTGDADDQVVKSALTNATCAQVEYWMLEGESVDIGGSAQSYSIGSVSVQRGRAPSRISERAKDFLFLSGLLSRAVGTL